VEFGGILESIATAGNHSLIWGFAKKKKNSSQSLFVLCFFFIEKKEIREEHKLLLGEMSQRNKKLRNEGKERIDFGQ
jgi:hypothetical protein